MPAKKLLVSTYLQYVLIGAGALLPFAFVRRLGGMFLPALPAGALRIMGGPAGGRPPRVLFAAVAATGSPEGPSQGGVPPCVTGGQRPSGEATP